MAGGRPPSTSRPAARSGSGCRRHRGTPHPDSQEAHPDEQAAQDHPHRHQRAAGVAGLRGRNARRAVGDRLTVRAVQPAAKACSTNSAPTRSPAAAGRCRRPGSGEGVPRPGGPGRPAASRAGADEPGRSAPRRCGPTPAPRRLAQVIEPDRGRRQRQHQPLQRRQGSREGGHPAGHAHGHGEHVVDQQGRPGDQGPPGPRVSLTT